MAGGLETENFSGNIRSGRVREVLLALVSRGHMCRAGQQALEGDVMRGLELRSIINLG